MAFSEFSFPGVLHQLGLRFDEADLYSATAVATLRDDFLVRLAEDVQLALSVSTEKARSEYIIAPILLELRRMAGRTFGLFSGVELDADVARGLNGMCDFILARRPMQFLMTAPFVAIVEAKNDNLRSGLGQCIAAMFAARLLNQQEASAEGDVFGVVTTGSAWRFLRLRGDAVTLDGSEYLIDNPGRIMGVLLEVVKHGVAGPV